MREYDRATQDAFDAGYAAGYRAGQEERTSGKGVVGSPPGRTEGQKMPGPLGPQSVATLSASRDEMSGTAQAATEGPAADLSNLCARLRGYNPPDRTIDAQRQMAQDIAEAADALERLARERDDTRAMLRNTNHDAARLASLVDKYKWQVRDTCKRAERAEAERDTLRSIVRAADSCLRGKSLRSDYDRARAAWKGEV